MATRLAVVGVCASLMWLTACGGFVAFIGTSPGFSGVLIVGGTCTSVQVVSILGPGGGFITVTAVTLFDNGFSNTLNFCGDLSDRFPLNRSLTIRYTNSPGCASLTSITIL